MRTALTTSPSVTSGGSTASMISTSIRPGWKSSIALRSKVKARALVPATTSSSHGPASLSHSAPASTDTAVATSFERRTLPFLAASSTACSAVILPVVTLAIISLRKPVANQASIAALVGKATTGPASPMKASFHSPMPRRILNGKDSAVSGASIGEGTAKEGMEQPVYYWDPVIAPSGMTFYTGDAIPGWKGSLLIGSLSPGALVRLELRGGRVVKVELMRRYRARHEGEPINERVQRGIHISINGIAAGLRNTG